MRKAPLVLVLAAMGFAASAQLTILPQAGIENPTTRISYNDQAFISPVSQLQPQFSIRADYKFKNQFSPYIGLSTSRSLLSYNFNDPENGMTDYTASLGKLQMQLQAGLQYSTKPLFFKKQASKNSSASTPKTKSSCSSSSTKNHCETKSYRSETKSGCSQSYAKNQCESKSRSYAKAKTQSKGWSVRLQPSAGIGFVPSSNTAVTSKTSAGQTTYTYNAGDINTALLTGMGFEFGKNAKRYFTLSVNYFKSLGDKQTVFTTESGTKTTTTLLESKVSGWNATLGFPINFSKKPAVKQKTKEKSGCEQYRSQYRCRKI